MTIEINGKIVEVPTKLLELLQSKGIEITQETIEKAKLAILTK